MKANQKGNKGEWSEPYVLIKLLVDGKLSQGDELHNLLSDFYYMLTAVCREDTEGVRRYAMVGDTIVIDGSEGSAISKSEFTDFAPIFLEAIKEGKGAFCCPAHITDFLKKIKCFKMKAGSRHKADIFIEAHDSLTGLNPLLGFSIKSQIGAPSTLFNTSGSALFEFLISGEFGEDDMNRVNSIVTSKGKVNLKQRFQAVCQSNQVTFKGVTNSVFAANLLLIDSDMEKILACLVKGFYSGGEASLDELVDKLKEENPLDYPQNPEYDFYGHKIKKFLMENALGMQAASVWSGVADATGGYIVVKKSGELVCYNLYNRNNFEAYLFSNSRVVTPDSRVGVGNVEFDVENQSYSIKLPLQVRFKK